jgi:hypothetical protein
VYAAVAAVRNAFGEPMSTAKAKPPMRQLTSLAVLPDKHSPYLIYIYLCQIMMKNN